ncbi:MAG: hypothetical protein ACO3A4_09005 [Silvanigrellaceae bacterium]
MKPICLYLSGVLPVLFLNSCAPGKAGGSGGIGCSKTSSVVKTPQIRTIEEITTEPSAATLRERFLKFFGSEDPHFTSSSGSIVQSSTGGLKTTGGYLYIKSRASSDPLGPVVQDKLSRCSVLVEFPKNTAQVNRPGSGSNPFPNTTSAIEAYRFPSESDELKIRVYTAAHCLDFSVNETLTLSIFNLDKPGLPEPSLAYVNLDVEAEELLAVKNLRKEIENKIQAGVVTNSEGTSILSAFRPPARNLEKIFGTDSSTPRGKCNFKPATVDDNTEQYSCATYHDLAVLDLTINETLTTEKTSVLKNIRSKWVQNAKAEENKGLWVEYVKPPFNMGQPNMLRLFVDNVLSSSVDSTLQSDAAKGTGTCVAFPEYSTLQSCTNLSADPQICPMQSSKLALFHPTIANCVEVPLDSPENLQYVRHLSRYEMRNFSRHNMVGNIRELTTGLSSNLLNLHLCSNSTAICSLTGAINSALDKVVPGLTLTKVNSDFQADYQTATKRVDAGLNIWNPFFAVANSIDIDAQNQTFNGGMTFDKSILKEMINPVDFLKLHSNFIVVDEAVTQIPDATDTTTHRAFMMMPMASIVGLEEMLFSASPSTKPIAIENWSDSTAGSGFGKFLRLFVKQSTLNSFFTSGLGDFTPPSPPPGVSLPPMSTIFVGANDTVLNQPLPTKVTLQKGDSGSIFTLDGIPMFALSTVNGEPTSGGAAVSAIPVAGADTDDTPPGGSVADNGGTDGQPVASVGGKGGGAVCK